MSTTSAPGWHVIASHKIVTLLVAVVAGLALTVVLLLTVGSDPATSQTDPTRTTIQPTAVQPTAGPGYQAYCNTRVVSFC